MCKPGGRELKYWVCIPAGAHFRHIQDHCKNIVAYREENGAFTDRKQLLKVPKLGPKAFEQCAGFMRISGGADPLDATSVHPESYRAARELLERLGLELILRALRE